MNKSEFLGYLKSKGQINNANEAQAALDKWRSAGNTFDDDIETPTEEPTKKGIVEGVKDGLKEFGKGAKETAIKNLKQIGADMEAAEYQQPHQAAMMGGLGGYYPSSFKPGHTNEETKAYREDLQEKIDKSTPEQTTTAGKAGKALSEILVPGSAPQAGIEAIATIATLGTGSGINQALKARKVLNGFKIVKTAEKGSNLGDILYGLAKSGAAKKIGLTAIGGGGLGAGIAAYKGVKNLIGQ
jgi:hypothetical protein